MIKNITLSGNFKQFSKEKTLNISLEGIIGPVDSGIGPVISRTFGLDRESSKIFLWKQSNESTPNFVDVT